MKFVINANHPRSQPAPSHCTMCQYVEGHLLILILLSFYATCWMLVYAYVTSSGKAKWRGPHHIIKMLHCVLFHSVTCYINYIVSRIHMLMHFGYHRCDATEFRVYEMGNKSQKSRPYIAHFRMLFGACRENNLFIIKSDNFLAHENGHT